ncbi:hypothetical protein HYPSUDRAFT_203080 [Hypholoma sublateritium FD-334 SS-4]|uniref:Uncharacterized protein n=1 Tax=Hypholoma sublateritium (strain FD-334 SS-4) TaxID=945553 RepID=A0A0D2NXV6_HYPSF|nr:hypothetical protein HYPSUDRAFT_203080 [Hypholoma sublateritium FD-334 SS-4]
MDHHRAQTLQSLEAFVETQRALLTRQREDIETLHRLKTDLTQQPSKIISRLNEELDDNAFRLSEQADCRLRLPKDIDWDHFENADATPLRTLTQQRREEINNAAQPCLTQCSELSDLQKLVKRARRTIVDPILIHFENMSSPEPESAEEIDPVERQRELERQKIRELKKRQIRGGLSLPLSRIAGSMGVFIRHDVDDEAMDVDVSIDDLDDPTPLSVPSQIVPIQPGPRPYAIKAPPFVSPPPKWPSSTKTFQKPTKEDEDTYTSRKKSKASRKSPSPASDDLSVFKAPKSRSGSTKPKPETYKQAWSTSEQNLLEQLLEEIPEGQKFRWQRISQAMGGRRTPRQVASRVQKYFEKLKKFSLL